MIRRDFLKLLGGAVLATQMPALLPAEEKTGDYCVRYIRAYDVINDRMVERVDMAVGMELPLPKSLESAYRVTGVSRAFIGRAIETMKNANVPIAAIVQLENESARLEPGMIIGVDFSR